MLPELRPTSVAVATGRLVVAVAAGNRLAEGLVVVGARASAGLAPVVAVPLAALAVERVALAAR